MRKISVIVPVYNVEDYIEECLESLINQTYKNLEIICINDGSTDKSGRICEEYEKKDCRIKVIHQENKGAGTARNRGLDVATGDYIAFVDGDDYVKKDMYEELCNSLIDNNAQIAGCETIALFKDRIKYPKTTGRELNFSGIEVLALSAKHWKYYIMVNKLFSREVVGNMKFPEGNIIDDGFFTYQIIAKASKVVWCDKALYFYRQRKSSVMNQNEYQLKRERDAIRLFKDRLEFVKENYPQVIEAFQVKMIDSYINIISRNNIDQKEIKKCIRYMKNNCREVLFKEYSYKESIWIILFMFFPKIMIKQNKGKGEVEKIKEGKLYE